MLDNLKGTEMSYLMFISLCFLLLPLRRRDTRITVERATVALREIEVNFIFALSFSMSDPMNFHDRGSEINVDIKSSHTTDNNHYRASCMTQRASTNQHYMHLLMRVYFRVTFGTHGTLLMGKPTIKTTVLGVCIALDAREGTLCFLSTSNRQHRATGATATCHQTPRNGGCYLPNCWCNFSNCSLMERRFSNLVYGRVILVGWQRIANSMR